MERTEGLMCAECIDTVTALTEDSRYPVREVAAWWFAKRPQLAALMAAQMEDDLKLDSLHVRNAADFLGAIKEYKALPLLRSTMLNGNLSADAKLALVRAAGSMAHVGGNPILEAGMTDADAGVRVAAIDAWRDVIHQDGNIAVVEARLGDSDAQVRAHAATVVGAKHDLSARTTLEQLVVSDADPYVRRNAAYALGKLGSKDSAPALTIASGDASGLVKNVAKAALSALK
ncbi:MAG TPA: HEAT repeat domain-containing protein [Kofleriaceae bacterium]|nr:HEAT repeat domain-containing protein [Kofleriaceae bacterium]